jgi:hypothetical protein
LKKKKIEVEENGKKKNGLRRKTNGLERNG